MIYTNKRGLPGPVYDMIANDSYSRGESDLSVTQLINPPKIRVLNKRHDSEIEVEADGFLSAALGHMFHAAVEASTQSGIPEKRHFVKVNGWTLSGAIDHYENGVIRDYKTANVWKMVYAEKGQLKEWENQLNVYAFLMRIHGYEVNELRIFALFKDWTRRDFNDYFKKGKLFYPNKSAGYPEREWLDFKLNLWSPERAHDYVLERMKLHQAAEETLPDCQLSDTWRGKRCKDYCQVNRFCDQYLNTVKTGIFSFKKGEADAI